MGYAGWAEQAADHAAGKRGEDEQTEAIGEGLSAVAHALLDVADAIRELAKAQRD